MEKGIEADGNANDDDGLNRAAVALTKGTNITIVDVKGGAAGADGQDGDEGPRGETGLAEIPVYGNHTVMLLHSTGDTGYAVLNYGEFAISGTGSS